jgi:hypothetical protein
VPKNDQISLLKPWIDLRHPVQQVAGEVVLLAPATIKIGQNLVVVAVDLLGRMITKD